ncbi:MAG: sensor histidine kinase, partial [Acidimicrobiia bacterium]
MLQRLKISRKLAIIVAIPLFSLVLLGLISAQTLQQVRIGGEAYGRIVDRKDLIADVLPPPLYLVEANLAVHRMVALSSYGTGEATDEVGNLAADLEGLETLYNDRLAAWKEHLDPADPVTKQLVDQVDVAGQDFWRIYHDEFTGTLEQFQTATGSGEVLAPEQFTALFAPLTAQLESLNAAFSTHKDRVETLVAMAQTDLELQEAAADELTRQQMLLLAGTALAIVLIVAAAGSLMARSISSPIRALTEAANEAATVGLPELVQTVRELPAGAELPDLAPLKVSGSEEIKKLSASFESLRNTAVQLAAGESQLRQNVSAMFVNLGRRNQNLLNRTLNFITSLEEHERNPETLDNLFRLDHLVTRMRRNAESLLVLAGTESTRTWSQPVEIGDIVRGALSEIEAYDRVDIGGLEPVDVRGNAAADVSHMLAELLENATTFSPPSAPVTVIGKYAHDGYLLSITDNGIGMTAKELRDANERLSQAGKFDTSPLMVLGLFVVSRLALRHGIQVRLAESPAEGVTAKVKLPLELLEGANPEQFDVAPDADFEPVPDAPEVTAAEAPSALLGLGGSLAEEFGGATAPPLPTAPAAGAAGPVIARRQPGATTDAAAAGPGPAPTAPAQAATPSQPAEEPKRRGLTRRTKGAQMPDTGPQLEERHDEPLADGRSPDAVREALSSFQGGVEYGRHEDEHAAPEAEPAAAPAEPPTASPVEPVTSMEPVE